MKTCKYCKSVNLDAYLHCEICGERFYYDSAESCGALSPASGFKKNTGSRKRTPVRRSRYVTTSDSLGIRKRPILVFLILITSVMITGVGFFVTASYINKQLPADEEDIYFLPG